MYGQQTLWKINNAAVEAARIVNAHNGAAIGAVNKTNDDAIAAYLPVGSKQGGGYRFTGPNAAHMAAVIDTSGLNVETVA